MLSKRMSREKGLSEERRTFPRGSLMRPSIVDGPSRKKGRRLKDDSWGGSWSLLEALSEGPPFRKGREGKGRRQKLAEKEEG